MIISLLFENPIMFFAWVISLVVAISIHEFAHAFAANSLGDPTAKLQGRLTLNPLSHLDPWGTLLLLFAGFGWGKPVPFNPYNLKNQKFGPAIISLAGPFSNFVLVVVFGLILKYLYPLTGLGYESALFYFLYTLIIINAILMAFNLIPIPPLDGSKILFSVLPDSMANIKEMMERYGFMILIMLVFLGGGIFSSYIDFVIGIVEKFIGI
ncbi:MAG: site-2 protease family protein [Parcubacteria group bacterium]|nr:site-2 protease family protein [Parcubacteria group bacterium]